MLEVRYIKHRILGNSETIKETMTQDELVELLTNDGMISLLSVNRIYE